MKASHYPRWLGLTVVVVGWLMAIRQLAPEWEINPQYQYGWFVPLLALGLWWQRWPHRPLLQNSSASSFSLWWSLGLGTVFILAWPVRLVQEANPEWRALNFIYAAQAVFLTGGWLALQGGRPWLRYFAFPLLFPLVAVPWPSAWEQSVIQYLQQIVASFSVECVIWGGWPAQQSGNLIVLPHAAIGVDEACSGIRSLQSTLMVSLFLGEYFHLTSRRRWALLALGWCITFFLNIVRALLLVVITLQGGENSFQRWHDPAGFGILFVCLLVLWFLAQSWQNSPPPHPVSTVPSSAGVFSSRLGWALLALWAGGEIFTAVWYGAHENRSRPLSTWTIRSPLPRPDFVLRPIEENARLLLRYDEGWSGHWTEDDLSRWTIFYLRWNPGRTAAALAYGHRPDICLPASGRTLEKDLGVKLWKIGPSLLPLHGYVFRDPVSNQPSYVFQGLTEDNAPAGDFSQAGNDTRRDRLQAVWQGRRNRGQRSVLLAIQSDHGLDEIEKRLQQLLQEIVQVKEIPVALGRP
jgi:exosortase